MKSVHNGKKKQAPSGCHIRKSWGNIRKNQGTS
jgi:hypothetical protein